MDATLAYFVVSALQVRNITNNLNSDDHLWLRKFKTTMYIPIIFTTVYHIIQRKLKMLIAR